MKTLPSFRAEIIVPAVLPIIIGAIIAPRPPSAKPINHRGSFSKQLGLKTSSLTYSKKPSIDYRNYIKSSICK